MELDKDNIVLESYDNSARQIPQATRKVEKLGFRDEERLLTEAQVKKETARCLGCGVCTTKCEFDAIHLYRERPECSTMYKAEDKLKAILPYMVKREIKIKKAARGKKN